LVWGSNYDFANPRTGSTARPLIITVGGDLHIGGTPSGTPSEVSGIIGDQWPNAETSGTVIVLVQGSITNHNNISSTRGSNITYYSVGSAPSLGSATVNANSGAQNLTIGGTTQTVQQWLTARLNPANNMGVWPIAESASYGSPARTLSIAWNNSGNITSAQRTTLNDRYGINTTGLNSIWYIDSDTILTNPTGAGGKRFLIIDTGLSNTNTVHVQLGSSGTFRWNPSNNAQDRVGILAVGNGNVVLHVPDTVTYCTGDNQSRVYIGPYNLAVARDSRLTTWVDCSRLDQFLMGANAASAAG
jgi:hypothetical protein